MQPAELLEAAQWEAARDAYAAALRDADDPEARDGYGLALWFLGEIDAGIAAREQAFDGFVGIGRCDLAARTAAWVSHQHLVAGRTSAARGWLARAERALDGRICEGHGWVAVERARQATSVDERVAKAQFAMDVARQTGASDLEVFALSLLGQAHVRAGRVADGMALLEEAMAAATAGRVRNVHTLAEAYCNLIATATSAGDWERAAEWCEMVDEFAQERGAMPLIGVCRTIHADVLVARGRWPEAEQALESALDTHTRYVREMGVGPAAAMAELRIRQGRLADAQALLAGRDEHPLSLRALAHLRLAEGRPDVAAALLERAISAVDGDAVAMTQLLAALVDARLAAGDLDGAGEAAAHLADIGRQSEIRLASARAELAAAHVALAAGRPGDAASAARRALQAFAALAMPLDVGEARLALARTLAAEHPALAEEEARAARDAFAQVGAARSLDVAEAVLQDLAGAPAARRRGPGDLTAREEEVLALVADGLSNAQIAQALCITEKTAGHHVSHILTKLGVRNRAQAAAHAARLGVGSR